MTNYKNYLKTIIFYFIMLIIYILLISIIYYFELLNYKTIRIINFIANALFFGVSGYKIASIERKKGYLKGFIISLIIILIFLILSLIIAKIDFNSLVYYLSLILSAITGGIIGVSKK